MLTYGLLSLAIVSEVIGTLALRESAGFSRLVPTAVVILAYSAAFLLLSIVLERGMAVAVAYAVWSAAGIVLLAGIGVTFLNESLSALQVLGLALVILGIIALELGTAAQPQVGGAGQGTCCSPGEER
jgi:small multidrug resistance pump